MRTQPLRIFVSAVPVEDEDLRDFALHLSYRDRGTPEELRIYDFPGAQQGTIAAIHLQIALYWGNSLELIRARRPHVYFKKLDTFPC